MADIEELLDKNEEAIAQTEEGLRVIGASC